MPLARSSPQPSSGYVRAVWATMRSGDCSKRSSPDGARREGAVAERSIIEVLNLTKTYDGVEALRGLDLQVPAASICGFLGRNGAGKTTTLKILLGMARPTS